MRRNFCCPQECGRPQEDGPVSMVSSCSKRSCGPCDPCPRFCLLSPPPCVPGSGDGSWCSHITAIAAVAPFSPMADTIPRDHPCSQTPAGTLWCAVTLDWLWPQEGGEFGARLEWGFQSLCLGVDPESIPSLSPAPLLTLSPAILSSWFLLKPPEFLFPTFSLHPFSSLLSIFHQSFPFSFASSLPIASPPAFFPGVFLGPHSPSVTSSHLPQPLACSQNVLEGR